MKNFIIKFVLGIAISLLTISVCLMLCKLFGIDFEKWKLSIGFFAGLAYMEMKQFLNSKI